MGFFARDHFYCTACDRESAFGGSAVAGACLHCGSLAMIPWQYRDRFVALRETRSAELAIAEVRDAERRDSASDLREGLAIVAIGAAGALGAYLLAGKGWAAGIGFLIAAGALIWRRSGQGLAGLKKMSATQPLRPADLEGLRQSDLGVMARLTALGLARDSAPRHYVDIVLLLEALGEAGAKAELGQLAQERLDPTGPGPSLLAEVHRRLAEGMPDGAATDLSPLPPPWNGAAHVVARGREWAAIIAELQH